MEPLSERQKTLIVNNVVKACKDISKLNKTGYGFLYLANGFIAHYNLYGFIAEYSDRSLKNDVLQFKDMNQWRNFIPTDMNYDYVMSKKDVYNRIVEAISK